MLFDLKILSLNHFDVIEKLINQKAAKTRIIVIAGDNQLNFIQRSVDLGISALLVKPVKTEDLKKVLNKIIAQLREEKAIPETTDHFITFRHNHSKLFVKQNDIIIIESNRNVCNVTFNDGSSKMVNDNITSIANKLVLKNLIRIDKSTIINLLNIIYIDGSEYNKSCKLKLVDGKDVTKTLSKIAIQRLYKTGVNVLENAGRNAKIMQFVLFLTFYVLFS